MSNQVDTAQSPAPAPAPEGTNAPATVDFGALDLSGFNVTTVKTAEVESPAIVQPQQYVTIKPPLKGPPVFTAEMKQDTILGILFCGITVALLAALIVLRSKGKNQDHRMASIVSRRRQRIQKRRRKHRAERSGKQPRSQRVDRTGGSQRGR